MNPLLDDTDPEPPEPLPAPSASKPYYGSSPSGLVIARARVEHDMARDCLNVFILANRVKGRSVTHMEPLPPAAYREVPEGDYYMPLPAFQLTEHGAQVLMDALIEAGIKPSGAAINEGVVASLIDRIDDLKEHIRDLRAIAGIVHDGDATAVLNPDKPHRRRGASDEPPF